MGSGAVGAGIVNIITESLYDKPIVVFREYVQNSVDSLRRAGAEYNKDLCCKIWMDENNLFFLDNGEGVLEDDFLERMVNIARSGKNRNWDIGYKGIGRLSGISYCSKLIFVNICSFKGKQFQEYVIDADKYNKIKWDDEFCSLEFSEAMEKIGEINDNCSDIPAFLDRYGYIFNNRDTGFLVVLQNTNRVLKQVIEEDDFYDDLGWLLPVKFNNELYDEKYQSLFSMFEEKDEDKNIIPAATYDITFNDAKIERPISGDKLRDYNCLIKMGDYAIGILSFPEGRMTIDTNNDFKGMRLYLDNMLLCDEGEIIPMLMQYGLDKHTLNEMIQSVRCVGVMIYITDKNSIYANARRTFIEVRDDDSLMFLDFLVVLVKKIYEARYAVSKYMNRAEQQQEEDEKIEKLRKTAEATLYSLANQEVTLPQIDKKEVTQQINVLIKEFMCSVVDLDYHCDNAYDSFITWLKSRK